MEVVKSNFDVVLPEILEAIQSSDMISIDMELTGIGGSNDIKLLSVDTPAQRYSKYRASAESYKPNQFGLCTFKWDSESKTYLSRAYNIYIFQQKYRSFEPAFVSASSSLSFLATHDFDFNKWIKEGISYLSLEQEQAIRQDLSNQKVRNQDTVPLSPADEGFVKDLLVKVGDWFNQPTNGEPKAALNLPPVRIADSLFLVRHRFRAYTIVYVQVSSYHRRLTYQEVSRVYPDLYLKTEINAAEGSRFISVQIMTEEQRAQREEEKKQQQEEELRVAIGFRHVIDALISAKKPLIGHNCFLDMLHLYHQFVADLPVSYNDFKSQVHQLFPIIFDTKQIMHENADIQTQLGSTVLGEIYAKIKKLNINPPISLAQGHDRYSDDTGLHEAGFDAYATGLCLFGICELMSKREDPPKNGAYPVLPAGPLIGPFANRLHLMKIRGHLKFGGPDALPSRDSLVWISGLTAEIRTSDVQRHFASFGKSRIHWVDDGQCILEFFGSEPKVVATAQWIASVSKDAPFNIRSVLEYDTLLDKEVHKNEEAGPASPGKFNRKRRRDSAAGEQPEQEAKKRRLSLGGVNCIIS